MNTPLNPTPSLLALTAPSAERAPDESPEPGFAEELSAATGTSDEPPHETESSVSGRGDEEGELVTPDDANDPTTQDHEPIDEQPAAAEPEQIADTLIIDNPLLQVAIVSETIVAETSPDADLPEHVATTLNVGLAVDEAGSSDAEPAQEVAPVLQAVEAFTDSDGSSEESVETPEPTAEPFVGAGPSDEEAAGGDTEHVDSIKTTGDPIAGKVQPSDTSRENAPLVTTQPPTSQSETSTASSKATPQPAGEDAESDTPAPSKTPASNTQPDPVAAEAPAASESVSAREAASPPAATPSVEAASERSGAERAAPTESRPSVDPSRFVNRVTRAIETAHERGGGPIEIRLSPPELGSLRVQIEMKEGVLSASLETETPAAKNTLLDNLPALRERLEQQQIRLEKFDVDVRDESQQRGGGGASEGETQRRSDDSPDRREPTPERRADLESSREEASSEVSTITFNDDGLNLVA